ncbi:MAG: hypothetical protein ACXV3V_02465 [Actinomycetes bacterium]
MGSGRPLTPRAGVGGVVVTGALVALADAGVAAFDDAPDAPHPAVHNPQTSSPATTARRPENISALWHI